MPSRERRAPKLMKQRLLPGPFLRVTVANFFFFLNFASFFLLPLRVTALGGSESLVGAVMGTFGVAALVSLPFVALTIDRFGRRRLLICGALGMSLASVGYLFVDRIGPAFFALRILQGFSFAAAFTATTTFAAAYAPFERRAQALGIFGLSTLLTHAIAPGLGELIIQWKGFTPLFIGASSCSLVTVALALPLPQRLGHRAAAAATAPAPITGVFWAIGATTLLGAIGFGTVITFISSFVHSEGLGRVGFFFAAYTSAAILSRLVGAGLSDSIGRRPVILPTLLGLGASIGLLALARTVPLLLLSGAAFGLAQGMSYPTLQALLVDLSVESNLGRAQALFNGAFNLGVTSSAFIFGMVAERFGYRTMFTLAATTPVAAFLVFYFCGSQSVPLLGKEGTAQTEATACDSSSTLSSAKRTASA